MSEVTDLVMPMLRDMRTEMRERFDAVGRRLGKLEEAQKSFKQALTSDTLLSRLAIGDFEQRLEALEGRTVSSERPKA